jgi:hypothetical protein
VRRNSAILLAVVVVVAMAVAIGRYISAENGVGEVVLSSVTGEVSLDGPGRTGDARVGTRMVPDDHLSTRDGRAVLALEGGTRVRIGPSSSVVVTSVDDQGVGLELEDGALRATVRPESGAVNVTGAGVTVQATDAEFGIGVEGDIAVLETTRGEVALMGTDQPRLPEGSRAVIRNRSTEIGPIPDELLLEVAWPDTARTRDAKSLVTGRTEPGARVTLDGPFGRRVVVADEKGRFEAEVPLEEGSNELVVNATDVLGQETDVRGVLQTRDTRGPTFKGGVEYDR